MQKSSHQKFHGWGLTFGFCIIYFSAPSSIPCLSRQMKTFPGVLIHNDLRQYTILVHNTARWTGLECLLNFGIYLNLLVPPDHFSIYTQQFYSRSTESSDLLLLNNNYVLQSAICVHHNIICSGDAGLIDFQLKKNTFFWEYYK